MGRFRRYVLTEEGLAGPDPMGGADPMGGGGMPDMGGADPMGGGGMGGMPGDPMGGGMGDMGGAPGGGQTPPALIPRNADVWSVIDSILHNKPFQHEKEIEKQKAAVDAAPPPADPMQGLGAEADPSASAVPGMDPAAAPPGLDAGQPAF